MATSHYKINVKDLKKPDEFVTTVDRIGNYLANNLMRVIIGTAIAIVLGAIIFTYFFYRSHMVRATADHFYDALVALNHKDYKTAEDGFDSVAHTGSGKLAHLAPLYAATAYMADHKPAEARDKLDAFIADSDNHLFKNLAMVQLGVAYENLGDYKKAHDTYVEAVAIPGPVKIDAQLGAARTLLKQGDKAGAIAAWRKFLVENPFSNERMGIIDTLAGLGAAPTDAPATSISPSTSSSGATSTTNSSPSAPSTTTTSSTTNSPAPAATDRSRAASKGEVLRRNDLAACSTTKSVRLGRLNYKALRTALPNYTGTYCKGVAGSPIRLTEHRERQTYEKSETS